MFSIFKRIWRGAAKALLCGTAISLTGVGQAQVTIPPTNILEFPIPLGNPTRPERIIYGPDGAYWFTEYNGGYIGRIETVSNTVAEIALLPDATPFGIVAGPTNGPTNAIFFTESGINGIGIIPTATSNYVHAALPQPNRQPWSMTIGPDKKIWFIEFALNKIASVDPNDPGFNSPGGTLTLLHEFGPFPTNNPHNFNSQLYGLTTGPDGKLWFTAATQSTISSIDTTGSNYMEFQLASEPVDIVTGPDGALWFTEFDANKIGRITTNGFVTEFPVTPSPIYPDPGPDGIITGNDGNLWFTEGRGGAVARMTTNGIVTIFLTPTLNSNPAYLATGSPIPGTNTFDTNIWFGEFPSGGTSGINDNIGELITSEALSLQADPSLTLIGNTFSLPLSGKTFTGILGTFENSNPTNTIAVDWGDGDIDTVTITNATAAATNESVATNFLSVVNTAAIPNFGVGSFVITASHTYTNTNCVAIQLTVTDSSNDLAVLNAYVGPAFFAGSKILTTNLNFLTFPSGDNFGFYSMQFFPFVYHQDLGFEFFFDANTGGGECYLYDYTSGHWWFTSRNLFSFVYDFSLNSWLYYSPNTSDPAHYTSNPRWFFNFTTMQWLNQ